MSLKEKYENEVKPYMMKKFGYKNVMQVPKVVKVTLNRGLGEALQNPRAIEVTTKEFEIITGQKPLVRRSKKNIAAFKLRKGAPIGVSVTLRKNKMWNSWNTSSMMFFPGYVTSGVLIHVLLMAEVTTILVFWKIWFFQKFLTT